MVQPPTALLQFEIGRQFLNDWRKTQFGGSFNGNGIGGMFVQRGLIEWVGRFRADLCIECIVFQTVRASSGLCKLCCAERAGTRFDTDKTVAHERGCVYR